MKKSTPSKTALLWDESFLWGLVSYRALKKLSLEFSLITSKDIRNGRLTDYRALFVPGGWASNKMKALGAEGAERVREFVHEGGIYIGICGGAGLATKECLGLAGITRKPLLERVPSVSGLIKIAKKTHPVWKGIRGDLFHIWWPSQFVLEDPSLKSLAVFSEATEGTFSSDLNAWDVRMESGWEELEKDYGLNLDPARMLHDPLVIEGTYGKGKLLLSLVHFDTPGDGNGEKVLKNIWEYFGLEKSRKKPETGKLEKENPLCAPLEELFKFGERNFLWFKRDWTIQWRRGVRGLEYFTLYEMAKEISGFKPGHKEIQKLKGRIEEFASEAVKLLMLERMALQKGEQLSFSRASLSDIQSMRQKLFSNSKSHGGKFKEILDSLDALVYRKLKSEE